VTDQAPGADQRALYPAGSLRASFEQPSRAVQVIGSALSVRPNLKKPVIRLIESQSEEVLWCRIAYSEDL
jgi:hypothetical protein